MPMQDLFQAGNEIERTEGMPQAPTQAASRKPLTKTLLPDSLASCDAT